MTGVSQPIESESVLSQLSHQLAALEKRDWELWLILAVTGISLGAGLLALLFPAVFFKNGSLHFEITVTRELFIGVGALLVLINTYVLSRRIELRRTRGRLISTTIQSEMIRLQSFTDPLTEVYNRRSFDEVAGRFINHARRTGEPLTFMLIDVDRFKQVNTRFGHLTGDFVLAEIAALLKNSVRGSDVVVRYGGDEFVVILSGTSRPDAAPVVNRITSHLREWNCAGHLGRFELSLSIGIAEFTEGQNLDQVLDAADKEMYAVKKGQRDQPISMSPA